MIPETVQAPRVVRDDGRTPFRAPVSGVAPTSDNHFVTKGWALANLGGGGAPTTAEYILGVASGSLPNGRALVNSFAVEWDVLTPGEVKANLGAGVVPAVLGVAAGYFSLLGHTHDAAEIVSGVMATARLGTGSPGSGTYLRGDGVWSAIAAFATASHTHAAADVTSGTFATARLGSGTASGTTFLKGDGSWSTIDLASAAVTGALPVAKGGTGATSASAARTALGAAAASHGHAAADISIDGSGWTGLLAGAHDLQECLDRIDAAIPAP